MVRVTPVAGSMENAGPVLNCTELRRRPSGLTSRPLRLSSGCVGAAGAVFGVCEVAGERNASHRWMPLWARCLIVAAVGLPVALRHRWPLPVLAVVVVASMVSALPGLVRAPFLSLAFVFYTVALTRFRRVLPTRAIAMVSVAALATIAVAGTALWWGNDLGVTLAGVAVVGA